MRYIMLLTLLTVAGKIYASDRYLYIDDKKAISAQITKAATKHKLERRLLSCLYFVESTYRLNVVSRTGDHGIGQVNEKTALWFKMDINRLTSDLAYSVDRSAYVLAYYKKLKHAEEPRQWFCRYNIGGAGLTKKGRGGACEAYLERINRCRVSDLSVL